MWVMVYPTNVLTTALLYLLPHFKTSSFSLASHFPSARFANRKEHWKLLYSLKTTVEGLVSTNNPNVWSRYGGLQRLHKDMNNILSNGLKNEQVEIWLTPLSPLCLFIFCRVCMTPQYLIIRQPMVIGWVSISRLPMLYLSLYICWNAMTMKT